MPGAIFCGPTAPANAECVRSTRSGLQGEEVAQGLRTRCLHEWLSSDVILPSTSRCTSGFGQLRNFEHIYEQPLSGCASRERLAAKTLPMTFKHRKVWLRWMRGLLSVSPRTTNQMFSAIGRMGADMSVVFLRDGKEERKYIQAVRCAICRFETGAATPQRQCKTAAEQ